jgi:hypothetical protein
MEREHNQARLARYLLGKLSEPEQVAIETVYFADKEKFEETWAAENDLIDAYLRGMLTPSDRELFEKRFLSSPRGREQLRAASIVLKSISSVEPAGSRASRAKSSTAVSRLRALFLKLSVPTPSLALPLGAVIVLLFVAVSWGLIETGRLRRQLLRVQTEQAGQLARQRELETQEEAGREQLGQLTQELARARDQLATLEAQNAKEPPSLHQVSFILTEGLARAGGETPTLKLLRGTEAVALKVTLNGRDYRSYTAELRTAEGAEVWRRLSVKAIPLRSGPGIVLRVPAARLAGNDYTLRLTGITSAGAVEDAGQYYFRVER